jgi:uncharacterized protein YpmS
MSKNQDSENHSLEIHSLLSNRDKKGKVNILKDGEIVFQFDVTKAKEVCQMLHEAIEAAISDEMIYQFFITKVKLDDARASSILLDFRELRQGSKETVYPS